ncbi:MAG: ABC transporter permease subunit [Acidobacteria bacterium]|nr:ABC transporter permease subunit [Acidobacteriota bacterium]
MTSRGRRSGQDPIGPSAAWIAPAALFLLVAFVAPFASLLRAASHGDPAAFLRELGGVWTQPHTRRALGNGLALSAAVSIAAILLCLPPAHLLARARFRGRSAARMLLSVPLSFSGVIVGFLAIVMLGRVGFVPAVAQALFGRPLGAGLAYALPGLFLAYLFFEIPRAVLALEAAFARLDPELDAAARTLGAGPVQRFTRVTLPALRPALLATFATTFSVSLGSYGAALILSRRFSVLPVEAYQEFTAFGNDAGAAAMAIWLAGISIAVSVAAGRDPVRGSEGAR